MSIGTRIKERRKELKLTQGDLIKAVGIKQATLSELETGESSGSRYLASIAAALGVSAYWLETGKGAKDVGAPPPIQTEKKQHPLIQNVIELMEKIDEDGKMAVLVAARSAAHARTMQIAEIEKMKREVADIQAVFDEFDTNEDDSALQQLKKRHTIPKS